MLKSGADDGSIFVGALLAVDILIPHFLSDTQTVFLYTYDLLLWMFHCSYVRLHWPAFLVFLSLYLMKTKISTYMRTMTTCNYCLLAS